MKSLQTSQTYVHTREMAWKPLLSAACQQRFLFGSTGGQLTCYRHMARTSASYFMYLGLSEEHPHCIPDDSLYIQCIYTTVYSLIALWVVRVWDSNLTHRCLIFSRVPAQTPKTDMTEWHTWKDGKKVVKEKAASCTQLEGLTKDSFIGDPDWHPMLSPGIFRPINF